MLTWTARDALNVTNSATGQENALPSGIAHEVFIAEPQSPQDTDSANTDPVQDLTLVRQGSKTADWLKDIT